MTDELNVKQHVRQFYDEVGWKEVSEGIYQNARYEDLRPVSRKYIHDCHMRVKRFLKPEGKYLLDAGSGPIQYPEYLEYSKGYEKRLCLDISITALQEARKRIGGHGWFVVADIAQLPFKREVFDGAVSLHTIHHLPMEDHITAYREVTRVLVPGASAALVNGWDLPAVTWLLNIPVNFYRVLRGRGWGRKSEAEEKRQARVGTFVRKYNARWLKRELNKFVDVEIRVWRAVTVRDLRFYVREKFAGRRLLKMLYWLEERFPRFFGRHGAYPLIVIRKRTEG